MISQLRAGPIGRDGLGRLGAPALARLRQLTLGGDEMGEERRLAVSAGRLARRGGGHERDQRTAFAGWRCLGALRRQVARP